MINTGTNVEFIEAEVLSDFILENLHDGLLPLQFYRSVTDFGHGSTLKIKTVGEAQIQELSEEDPYVYTSIESGEVTLVISEYVGDAYYITDDMREDGHQIEELLQARGREGVRALQEDFETKALKVFNEGQTNGDANLINGTFPRRMEASGTNGTMSIKDIVKAKLTLDKSDAPYGGRVFIVDPIVEATLNAGFTGNFSVDKNPQIQDVMETGFARDHTFVMNFLGFNFLTSNRLHKADDLSDGTGGIAGEKVANVYMCIQDDQCKPLMCAWRRQPKVEGERNKDLRRSEYVQSARYGFGLQRKDTYGIVITSASAFE